MRGWLSMLVLAVTVSGCVTATPYQPADGGYGYADQRIEDRRFRVTFSGNDATPRARVENYLLFRAAEITLANGGTHFLMGDVATESQTSYTQTLDSRFGFGYYSTFGGAAGLGVGTSTPRSTRYDAQAYIVVLEDDQGRDDLKAFDARQVQQHLGPTIVRPE